MEKEKKKGKTTLDLEIILLCKSNITHNPSFEWFAFHFLKLMPFKNVDGYFGTKTVL